MARTAQPPELEVDRDERFQRREWRIQRISWVLVTLIIVAGLLGAFGGGPLAHATASASGVPIRLDYDRTVRYEVPSELRIILDPSAIRPDGVTQLWLPHRYLDHVAIEQVTPQPVRTIGGASGALYEFHLTPGQAAVVSFTVKPRRAGMIDGQLVLPDRRGLSFRQFVFP